MSAKKESAAPALAKPQRTGSIERAAPASAAQGVTGSPVGNQAMQRLVDARSPAPTPDRGRQPEPAGEAPAQASTQTTTQSSAQSSAQGPGEEPADAPSQRRAMGSRFGMSFSGVTLRTGPGASAKAERAGARAYNEGDEIGFAAGAYEPHSQAGQLTIAHEFAHVAQRRGGNASGPAWPAARSTGMAEWQAHRAAAAVVGNGTPRVSGFAARGALYDDGKGGPSISSTDDQELLDKVLQMLATQPVGEQRRGAISFLVGLAVGKGKARDQASSKVIELLSGIPNKSLDDHMAAIEELKAWTAKEVRAYELLLYGRYWFADHSQPGEVGSGLALDAFRKYLHYDGGKWAIIFFRLQINGDDVVRANLAARIVADLLEGENEPGEEKYKANYAALRAMARTNGWDSFGPLAVASATPRIFSALDAMRQEADTMRSQILNGPINDPTWEQEIARLQAFVDALSVKGPQSSVDANGVVKLLYTAENREETEHALITKSPKTQGDSTQEMARALTIAVDAGIKLQGRLEVLHSNALALDKFLGVEGAKASDERLALFDLRHDYIEAWLSVATEVFGANSGGLAAGYQARLDEVDRKFENFDQVVAVRKFKSARDKFVDYSGWWNEGNLKYGGNDQMDEKFFFTMRNVLQDERNSLSSGFSLGAGGMVGGTWVHMKSSDDYIPTDLNQVAALDRDTTIFGMQSALFMVYATNLSIHNMMIKSDIGSKNFRAEQGGKLIAMRAEMEDIWNKGDYGPFMNKTKDYEQTLKDVVEDIKDRAKIDFLLGLAITLIAALLTEGAALAVRLGTLSETLAIARTARALSSLGVLTEVGVFTASELALQKAFFGKDITAAGAVKSFATNLAFLGAMKAIGKIAEPLSKGSNVRKLMMGHLVGFAGVATVSATLTRIETGQWPPDMATFLAQTAITYLFVAGMHHAFQEMVAKPKLKAAGQERWDKLASDNEAMVAKVRMKIDLGTLTKSDFDEMRAERTRIVEEVRSLYELMKDGGLISAAEMQEISQACDNALADLKSISFVGNTAADPVMKALPAPDSVPGLVRVGNTDIYDYDPTQPHADVDNLLQSYKDKGFTVRGNNALMRIISPAGRTVFLLNASPTPNTRLMLPAPSGADTAPADALSRATALNGTQLDVVRNGLAKINREAETKLGAEYPDHTVLATLAMLVDQASIIKPNWAIDSVRGVADALSLERGIPRSAIRRLFLTVDPAKLPQVFSDFHDVVTSPKVSPASRFVIAEDMLPKNSLTLIDALRQMQKKGIELPVDIDRRAVRGLARQIDKMPGGWLQWLSGIAKEERGNKLRTLSGLVDPTLSGLPSPAVNLPENVTELLDEMSRDIAGQPGLNPLAGADGEAFVKAIESKSSAAKFSEPGLRLAYVDKVDRMRVDAAELQQGRELEHGTWENIVGRANEVRKIASVLLGGGNIHVSDRDVGSKGQLPSVNMTTFTMPGGGKIVNVPPEKDVHMDLLYTDATGKLTALEMTTGELNLPTECQALDPKNPAYGGDVDWAALELRKKNASVRKFMQAIKIYQLRKMAAVVGSTWSGEPVDPATTRFQAGDFSAGAARAFESMGFQMELTDGTPQTAAQVEARKKPGGSKKAP